jgi:TolB-like protein/DNA-binding winged helix-turn-helix (wHTH) protein
MVRTRILAIETGRLQRMDQVRIGTATVNFSRLTIEGEAGSFSVEPMVLQVLRALMERPGEVVSRETLIDQVWGVSYGGDERLSRAISLLRKALGEDARQNRCIETIPKRGYRLLVTPGDPIAADEKDSVTATDKPVAKRLLPALAVFLVITAGIAFFALAKPGWLGNANQGLAATGVAPEDASHRNSIAVLPFTDLSKASDQRYLADGLTEEILDAIMKFPDLRVVGRTSSFRYAATEIDPRKVGSDLNSRYLLIGSLRKQDERLRVAAQLVEAADGRVVWSQTFAGSSERIFEFQESIARAIASELGVAIAAKDRVLPRMTANKEAYELFLKGREMARRFGRENKRAGMRLLEQAIRLDPQFALAWAWLGNAKLLLAITEQPAESRALVAEARSAVDKAKAIDPNLAMGHFLEAVLHDYDLDFAASMDAMERAYAADPNQPYLIIRRGRNYAMLGQIDKAEELIEEGLRRDPTDAIGIINLSRIKLAKGELDEAQRLAIRSRDLGFVPAGPAICAMLNAQGSRQEAQTCWARLPDEITERYRPPFVEQGGWSQIGKAVIDGDADARQRVFTTLQDHFTKPDPRVNNYLMDLYLTVGTPEALMQEFVEHPYSGSSSSIASVWIAGEPYSRLRRDPAFPAFAARIGLVRAWEKYGWPNACRRADSPSPGTIKFSCI